MFIGKNILILMLFSIALRNYFFYTSQGTKFLYSNASSCFDMGPILFVLSKKRNNYSSCMFWIELKQKIHWEKVETIVWHTTPKMRGKKYLMHYKTFFHFLT
jgi:hypothetical protein